MAKPIESLRRGLEVQKALISTPFPLPLHTLHQLTLIPKASLLAILETLQAEGVVARLPEGGYTLTSEWLLGIHGHTTSRTILAQNSKANPKEKKT